MRYLEEEEIIEAWKYMREAVKEARKSTCKSSQRGVVIVKDGKIVGRGYNKVTIGEKCNPCLRENIEGMKMVELCHAIHAEQMAILNTDRKDREDSTMYHVRVKNGKITTSNEPVCTVCSRMIKESGIKEFVLYTEKGFVSYSAEEFNEKSFENILKTID